MPEDKLTTAQRLRLESFAQAINSGMTVRIRPAAAENVVALNGEHRDPAMADLFRRAEEIEQWLKQARG